MLEFPTIVVVAQGVEGVLARWEAVEKLKVVMEKSEVEKKYGAEGGEGNGVEVREGGKSEKGGNPPDATAPAPGDSEAASRSAAELSNTSAAEVPQTATINAQSGQPSHQPSLALPPPLVSIHPSPIAAVSRSELL